MNVFLGRDVCYFTFGDRQLVREGFDLYSLLSQRAVTVGHLFRYTVSFTSTLSALEQWLFWKANWGSSAVHSAYTVMAQGRCWSYDWYGLAISLAYSCRGSGYFTCSYEDLHAFAALRRGRGVSTMWYLPIAL
jgi:hypothetical protein